MALAPLCPMLSPLSEGNQSVFDMPFPPTQARTLLPLQRQEACVEHLADFVLPTKGCKFGPLLLRIQTTGESLELRRNALARMRKHKGSHTKASNPTSPAITKTTSQPSAPLPAPPVSPLGRRMSPQRQNHMIDLTPRKPVRFNRLTAATSPKLSNKSPILRTLSSGRLLASPSRSPSRSNIGRRTKSGSGLLRC